MDFQLPYRYQRIGLWVFVLCLLTLLTLKFFEGEFITARYVFKKIMLVSLLVVAVSRDAVDDERVKLLRGKAYALAFITGVAYALIQPQVNYLVGLFLKPESTAYADLGDFQVLWFMLVVYLCFFNLIKRQN